MPTFSVFQDFTAFKFSGKPSRGEMIYRALVAIESGAFDLTPGTYEEARIYATAMGLARARYTLERAQNQTDPLKAIELLPQLEHDWGVVAREFDGIVARQRRVAAAFLLAKGAIRSAIEAGLRNILGNDFLALVPMDPANATIDESLALFSNPKLPFKLVRISPVTAVGVPFVVDYVNADTTATPITIDVDDKLVIEPENTGLQEVVTVVDADLVARTFTATFANAHDDQSFASTQNYVPWTSTQCSLMVVTKPTSALDAEARRLVNEFMDKVSRGVWTWSIVQPTTPGAMTVGPFALDTSPLGAVPLGSASVFYIPAI